MKKQTKTNKSKKLKKQKLIFLQGTEKLGLSFGLATNHHCVTFNKSLKLAWFSTQVLNEEYSWTCGVLLFCLFCGGGVGMT